VEEEAERRAVWAQWRRENKELLRAFRDAGLASEQ
jgi:hypothetical protein